MLKVFNTGLILLNFVDHLTEDCIAHVQSQKLKFNNYCSAHACILMDVANP